MGPPLLARSPAAAGGNAPSRRFASIPRATKDAPSQEEPRPCGSCNSVECASASCRKNSPNRAIAKPKPISEIPVLTQASMVRSLAWCRRIVSSGLPGGALMGDALGFLAPLNQALSALRSRPDHPPGRPTSLDIGVGETSVSGSPMRRSSSLWTTVHVLPVFWPKPGNWRKSWGGPSRSFAPWAFLASSPARPTSCPPKTSPSCSRRGLAKTSPTYKASSRRVCRATSTSSWGALPKASARLPRAPASISSSSVRTDIPGSITCSGQRRPKW